MAKGFLLMLNMQEREKTQLDKTGMVDVHSMWLTIQGEGPLVGTPAVFIRLAGCNLQCPLCDTDYTSQRKVMSPKQILDKFEKMKRAAKLVVLTGGEPFRQNIAPLVELLLQKGYAVQVETNGTIFRDNLPYSWNGFMVICSPKTPKIADQLYPHIRAFKYIVAAGKVDPADGLPTSALGMASPPARPDYIHHVTGQQVITHLSNIYVQPLDEQDPWRNKQHLTAAINSCKQFGYRLCIQTHKLINEA